jgi:putative hydrolase of the HAD superfamily
MAKKKETITTLFLDIGGVLLTNGWDRQARRKAATLFKLDEEEMNERHHLTFDTYETGKLTLDEYLNRTVFYTKRKFSKKDFIKFIFDQSQPIEGTLDFFKELKEQYQLRVIAVSNEAREINEYRIKKYKLNQLFNGFVSSCYVHLRKPDADIFHMAINIAQTPLSNILYVDDRDMFVEVARSLKLHAYHFQGLDGAKKYINSLKFSAAGIVKKDNA